MMGRACRSAFKILTGRPTGKRPLGRPRCRWEDNIRMDLEELRLPPQFFFTHLSNLVLGFKKKILMGFKLVNI